MTDASRAGDLSLDAQRVVEAVLDSGGPNEAVEACRQLIMLGTPLGAVEKAGASLMKGPEKESLVDLQQAMDRALQDCLDRMRSADNRTDSGSMQLEHILRYHQWPLFPLLEF